ncbi:unnamed protein product [Peronospora farinosa]|uniref:Uncharacterized protein n=1 Tax=Peronospora farinosa TaxID=134698 RepID=A0ABN8CE06_9STRA|nr:unnamed protein product [Peronospora farinosa]
MTNQKIPGTGNGGDAMKMNEVEISTVESTLDKTMQTKDSTVKNVALTLNDDKGMGRSTTLDDEVPCDDVTQKMKSKGNLPGSSATVAPDITDSTIQTVTHNMSNVAETVTPVGKEVAYAADHTTDTLTNNLANVAETVTPVGEKAAYTADSTVNTATNNMPTRSGDSVSSETVTSAGEKAAYAADHTTDTLTNITSNAVMTVTPAVEMVAETSMETVVNTTPYVTKTVAPVAKTATDTVAYTATSPTATTPIPASIPTPLATTIPASSYDIVGQIVDKTTGVEAPSTMPPATTAPTTTGVATTEQSLHRDEEEETESSLLISQTSADETDLDSDQSIPTSKEITSVDDNADNEDSDSEDSDSEDSDSEDSDSEDSDSEDSDSKDRETGGNSVPARKSSLSSGNVAKKPLTTTSPATKTMKSDDSASFAPDAVDRNSGLHSEKSGFTFASPPPADSAFKPAAMKGSSVSDISKPEPKKTTLRPEHSAPTEVPAQPFSQVPVETAPKVPVETAPQVAVETAPQVPVETAPQVPVQTAPQVPIETAPQVPVETAPQVPAQIAPQAPAPTVPQAPAPTVPQVPGSPVQAEAATASPLSITSDSGLESVEAQAQRAAAVSGDKKDVSSLLLVGVAGFGCVAIIAIVAFMKKPNHVTDETIGPDGERISTTAAMEACNFEGSISNDPLGTRYSSIVMITPNGDGMCIL